MVTIALLGHLINYMAQYFSVQVHNERVKGKALSHAFEPFSHIPPTRLCHWTTALKPFVAGKATEQTLLFSCGKIKSSAVTRTIASQLTGMPRVPLKVPAVLPHLRVCQVGPLTPGHSFCLGRSHTDHMG